MRYKQGKQWNTHYPLSDTEIMMCSEFVMVHSGLFETGSFRHRVHTQGPPGYLIGPLEVGLECVKIVDQAHMALD